MAAQDLAYANNHEQNNFSWLIFVFNSYSKHCSNHFKDPYINNQIQTMKLFFWIIRSFI